MKRPPWIALVAPAILALVAPTPHPAQAHCDGLDGPVVRAAQQALAENNVSLALVWVQKANETEIKRIFEKTLAVRKLGPEAKELADHYFFETLVRIHRAGEGAPFTGLKPPLRDLGPAIPAGDKALETGKIEPVLKLLTSEMERGLHRHFVEAMEKKKAAGNDVLAGRSAVSAYVAYIHYVEGLHRAAKTAVHAHPEDGDAAPAHKEAHQDEP